MIYLPIMYTTYSATTKYYHYYCSYEFKYTTTAATTTSTTTLTTRTTTTTPTQLSHIKPVVADAVTGAEVQPPIAARDSPPPADTYFFGMSVEYITQ